MNITITTQLGSVMQGLKAGGFISKLVAGRRRRWNSSGTQVRYSLARKVSNDSWEFDDISEVTFNTLLKNKLIAGKKVNWQTNPAVSREQWRYTITEAGQNLRLPPHELWVNEQS